MMSPKLSFCLLFIVVLLLSSSTLKFTQVVGPIGFNQLVSLDASGNAVIRLTGFDTTGVPVCVKTSITHFTFPRMVLSTLTKGSFLTNNPFHFVFLSLPSFNIAYKVYQLLAVCINYRKYIVPMDIIPSVEHKSHHHKLLDHKVWWLPVHKIVFITVDRLMILLRTMR